MSVIVFPLSEIAKIPAAVKVTSVLPDVFELIMEVVPVPAFTVSEPSFVIEPSTSVTVSVKVLPVRDMVSAPAGSKVIVPPLNDKSSVLLSPAPSPALIV